MVPATPVLFEILDINVWNVDIFGRVMRVDAVGRGQTLECQ
jgi:hypothetical protein